MKYISLIIGLSLLSGCEHQAESTVTTTNQEFRVEKLFTNEGCTVYRFYDVYTRYYVHCTSGEGSTTWQENCGKNCHREVQVSTQ